MVQFAQVYSNSKTLPNMSFKNTMIRNKSKIKELLEKQKINKLRNSLALSLQERYDELIQHLERHMGSHCFRVLATDLSCLYKYSNKELRVSGMIREFIFLFRKIQAQNIFD